MCDAMSGIALGLQAVGIFQGYADAKSANAAKRKQFAASAAIVNDQLIDQYSALDIHNLSVQAANTQDIQNVLSSSQEAQAVLATRAADAGVAGKTVGDALQEVDRDAGDVLANLTRNRILANIQTGLEKMKGFKGAKAVIMGLTPSMTVVPNIALQLAGAGLDFFKSLPSSGPNTNISTSANTNALGTSLYGTSTAGGYGMTSQGFISMAE
jgi:hypothetical protein